MRTNLVVRRKSLYNVAPNIPFKPTRVNRGRRSAAVRSQRDGEPSFEILEVLALNQVRK